FYFVTVNFYFLFFPVISKQVKNLLHLYNQLKIKCETDYFDTGKRSFDYAVSTQMNSKKNIYFRKDEVQNCLKFQV
ncbi:unnamed protein product, partial [Tenebrio molitor]